MENDKNKSDIDPIIKQADVQQSNNGHIDQDFAGFPHNPAKENF